jgi:hypothetical protein
MMGDEVVYAFAAFSSSNHASGTQRWTTRSRTSTETTDPRIVICCMTAGIPWRVSIVIRRSQPGHIINTVARYPLAATWLRPEDGMRGCARFEATVRLGGAKRRE